MKKRIITGCVMAVILLPLVFIPKCLPALEVVFIIFAGFALWELLHMYETRKEIPLFIKILCYFLMYLLFLSIVSSIPFCKGTLIYDAVEWIGLKLNIPIVVSIIVLLLLSCLVFFEQDANDIGKYFLAIFYVGSCFASLISLRAFGARFIVYILIITMGTDIFALVFGMLFGKHKMAPRISPKKTWEGAVGGTCIATIAGSLFIIFYPEIALIWPDNDSIPFFTGIFDFSTLNGVTYVILVIVMTIFLSMCSQVGDLIASKLKRTYGIKDYSQIFPGHGGVLDRFDSLLFAAPMFILFIQLMYQIIPNIKTDVVANILGVLMK